MIILAYEKTLTMPTSPTHLTATNAPTTEEVEKISRLADPILRNLMITHCYCELSKAFSARTGTAANWSTFATWASKQAGVTIRGEDLQRTMEQALKSEPALQSKLVEISTYVKSLGNSNTHDQIQQSVVAQLVQGAIKRASDAVARGNRKVFEEIGYEFARFIAACLADKQYNGDAIDKFCNQLRDGDPPDGQDYLKRAFHRYYLSFFETDKKKRQEMQLLSNVEIGFHEQTRLQPEIAESLNAALVDPARVKEFVGNILLTNTGIVGKFIFFASVLRGKRSLLNHAIDNLAAEAEQHLRKFITAALMTLTIPPNNCLRLGKDLNAPFCEDLQQLTNADLIRFLARIDPTANSLKDSGATDWARLEERLHYIADLFRCFHDKEELFTEAFSPEQLTALKAGRIPAGRL